MPLTLVVPSRSRRSAAALRLTALMCMLGFALLGSSAVGGELGAPDVLDRESWQEAEGRLPEAVLRRFEDGSYRAKIANPTAPLEWGRRFLSASRENVGRFSIDEGGSLIADETQTYPELLYGYPFPRVSPEDEQAAAKVIYNFSYAMMQGDDAGRFSTLHWVSPRGLEDQVEFQGRLLFLGSRASSPLANPKGILRKGIIFGVDPEAVRGTVIVEEVYLDPARWNSLSAYVPELKRMRPLPSADGSDNLFGSDLAHDDLYVFSGKVQYFTWKLLGVQNALVPFTEPNPKALRRSERGYVLEMPSDLLGMGWQKQDWEGMAWWPTHCRLIERPVWIIEATAKDSQYAYQRQVLWIDREIYVPYYKEAYDRAGRLWRMLTSSVSIARTPDGEVSVAQPDFILSVDEVANRATVELPGKPGQPITFGTIASSEEFTPDNVKRW